MGKTHLDNINNKILDLETALIRIAVWKNEGQKIVFTNGCFDILHKGHVSYLAQSADLGDRLIIGLNSDASVKVQQKGDNRPINSQEARAFLLSALEFTDLVIIYDDPTPLNLISKIQPNVLVKGADYDAEETNPDKKTYIVGSDLVKREGGLVRTIQLEEGFSTTTTIQKIRNHH